MMALPGYGIINPGQIILDFLVAHLPLLICLFFLSLIIKTPTKS